MDARKKRMDLLRQCLDRLTDNEFQELIILLLSPPERTRLTQPATRTSFLGDLEQYSYLDELEDTLRSREEWRRRLRDLLEPAVQVSSSLSSERHGKGYPEKSVQEDLGKTTMQIFLSYAREDASSIENLYQRLSDAGFKPWMDKKDILPGEQWRLSIQRAIRNCDFFLVCLSASSVSKRGFLQKEIKDALDIWREKLDGDIYLIPVRLEDCEVPASLRSFQWVSLFEADGWARLVKSIQVGMERRAEH